MKKKTLVLNLLVISILVLSTMGAAEYKFGDGWKIPKKSRKLGISGPMPESSLGISSDAMMSQDTLLSFLPKLSAGPAQIIAKSWGLSTLDGKKLEDVYEAGIDNPVSVDSTFYENDPSMAVNPTNEQVVVVFNNYVDNSGAMSCLATASFDGGDTFSYENYVIVPQLNTGDYCSDPVVRFSPDGKYAYYFYMNMFNSTSFTTSDILMQKASGTNPATLIGTPVVVFEGGSDFMDKEWGDVHTYDQRVSGGANAGVLYASATKFYSNGDCAIVFNVSHDYGVTWQYSVTDPYMLDYSAGCSRVVQGSRPIGGNNGFVIVCWYDSHTDGYLAGSFYIDCIANDAKGLGTSSNWSTYFSPGGLRKYELAEFLGPNSSYHRWQSAMYPSLAVDEEGMAYIAFTADPTSNRNDTEAGNVYLTYRWLDYDVHDKAWKAPVAVGSGSTAQGFATVAARYDPSTNKYFIYVGYGDYTSQNKGYNTTYRKGTRSPRPSSNALPSIVFGSKVKVSDRVSVSDHLSIGDYIDSAVTARRYHIVWTDRADAYDKFDEDDDVLHDVFVP